MKKGSAAGGELHRAEVGYWVSSLDEMKRLGRKRAPGEARNLGYDKNVHPGIIVRAVQADMAPAQLAALLGVPEGTLIKWLKVDPELRAAALEATRPMQATRLYEAMYKAALSGNVSAMMVLWKDMGLDRSAHHEREAERLRESAGSEAQVKAMIERGEKKIAELRPPIHPAEGSGESAKRR